MCGVLHLDLKPQNVLLMSSGAAVLADFGSAVHIGTAVPDAWGTPEFRCPEHPRASAAADVYGAGATLLTLWPVGLLIEGMIWQRPACVQSAIDSCLKLDSGERPSMCAVLQDPAWSAVANNCTRHMRWDAECRLRAEGWYSFHTTFRFRHLMSPEMQMLRLLLQTDVVRSCVGDGLVADADWL